MKATIFHNGLHLSETQISDELKQCPICQSTNRSIITNIQKNPDIFLKYCHNCHAVSASRLPTKESLDTYYNSYYQSNDEKITFDKPGVFANHLFNETHHYQQKQDFLKILDFGGGGGLISIELAKRYLDLGIKEVKVVIVDYDSSIINNDVPGISIDKYSLLSSITDQKFDLIIASAIVEHLPNPKNEMTTLFELLEDEGQIYFRTPYIVPILLLLKKIGIIINFTYPGHIHDMGQEFWDNILKTFNMQKDFKIMSSKPSIIETSFSKHFYRTLAAYFIKSPWYILGNTWNFVGGWEILIQKKVSWGSQENSLKDKAL